MIKRRAKEQLCCWEGACSIPEFYSVADPKEGPGGPGLPIILDQTETRRAEKIFFGDRPPPLNLRIWMTWTPPYLKIWIQHSYLPPKLLQYIAYASLFAVMAGPRQGGHKLEHILFLKVH